MQKVIFDTDIGIDDAMALLFLHHAPGIDLLAIISGFGNASIANTTRNALHMKEYFDIRAPVYRGAALPITAGLPESYPDFVHGSNGLGDIEFVPPALAAEPVAGAQAIVELARRYPHEICIVAVGRMTNLAHALRLCPELPTLVPQVIVMGGAFGNNGHCGNVTPFAEANIAGDPVAAEQIFNSGLNITVVGLDVTEETIATSEFFDTLLHRAGKSGDFIHRISRFYLEFHRQLNGSYACPVHDSSAVACLLMPELFVTRSGHVRVTTGGKYCGRTEFSEPQSGSGASCRICTAVDSEALLQLYLRTLGSGRN